MDFQIDPDGKEPLYQQIADQIRDAIEAGRLKPGDKLPSVRRLTAMIGVSHVTAVKVYEVLAREGVVRQSQGRGTFVARPPRPLLQKCVALPAPAGDDPKFAWQRELGVRVSAAKFRGQTAGGGQSGAIAFTVSYSEPQLWPLEAISRALKRLADHPETVGRWAPPTGDAAFREAIVPYLRHQGVPCDAGDVIVTDGTQQAIDLVVRTFVRPGEWVACENPTYAVFLDVLRSSSINILPVPVDEEGMKVDALQEALQGREVRLIYTMPTFHNPTGSVMSPERRRRLLAIAEEHGCVILEDDPYRELYFHERPPAPIKSMDEEGRVIYLSGLTKLLCPGFRLGVVVASGHFRDYLVDAKIVANLSTNTVTQGIVRHLLTDFDWRRHFAVNREKLRARRDLLVELLAERLPGVWIPRPPGGMNLFLGLPDGLTDRSLRDAALREGAQIAPGHVFFADRHESSFVRLSFGGVTEEEIRVGVDRLAAAWNGLMESLRGPYHGNLMPFV